MDFIRHSVFSVFLTAAAVLWAGLALGWGAAVTTLVLIAIEIAFSFDNAIINAKILEKLSRFWQQLFLTLGMIIAILGMRLVFPVVIVMATAHLSWSAVIDSALHHPDVYGRHLEQAHVSISAFGGAFLLVLTLYFLFDDERKDLWLKWLERRLQKLGIVWLPPVMTALVVVILSRFAGHDAGTVLRAGLIGTAAYTGTKLFIDGLGRFTPAGTKVYGGWAAFGAFMYLQLLDASFSFDGVLGAFAITNKVLLIALGLGVGALWVRSLTVYLVRRGTLKAYIYLEHGAHYAILVLAAALLASIYFEVPDAVTGITGLGVILASFISSRQAKLARESA